MPKAHAPKARTRPAIKLRSLAQFGATLVENFKNITDGGNELKQPVPTIVMYKAKKDLDCSTEYIDRQL